MHHSRAGRENRSNFANLFSWWDRLFGTYIEQPAAGHDKIVFGLSEFQERKHATLPWMLVQPFLPEPASGRSHFQVLCSWFVFRFRSGSVFGVPNPNQAPRTELEHEPRTEHAEV